MRAVIGDGLENKYRMKMYSLDKFVAWLTLVSGLTISLVAEYYSILGLVAIFAAAAIPVIIMGIALGVGKVVATIWLKLNWERAPFLIKSYLTIAVLVLMFITSMGIFGFLSKAHVDQASNSSESAAQIQKLTTEIARQTAIVSRAEARLKQLETTGIGADANVQSQINEEQKRIDSAYSRVQPAIDEQQKIIDGQTKLYADQIAKIDEQIAVLQKYIDSKEIDKAQGLVGTRADGNWGPGTAAAVRTWQAARATERSDALAKLEQANNNPTIRAAREEIARVRKGAESQIADSNKVVNRLRDQLGKTSTADVEKALSDQQTILKEANADIDKLTQQKYAIEAEYRKLEAEVGPVKFIAEFIYGDNADANLLEKAVTWVIIILIVVFDPLALILLLASQYSFGWFRQIKEQQELIDDDRAAMSIIPPLDEATRPFTEAEIVALNAADEETKPAPVKQVYLQQPFTHFPPGPPVVYTPPQMDEDDEDHEENETVELKAAKTLWKSENPHDSLKHQRKLFEEGVISELPWEKFLVKDDAAEEALKWAEEQAEKKRMISWMEREGSQQIKKSKEE
jgi:hypothetical protein